MHIDDAIHAVAAGSREGAWTTGVATGLIVCCLRHQSLDVSLAVADAAVRHRHIVAGLDLAGDESYPGVAPPGGVRSRACCWRSGDIHAGEAAGPASVWEAIDVLGARRIGHGVRSVDDQALIDRLHRDDIPHEMCPRCNALTGAVPSMADHPADRLLARGLAVTINTDGRTTADTSLRHELTALVDQFGWTSQHWQQAQDNARNAAFASEIRLVFNEGDQERMVGDR